MNFLVLFLTILGFTRGLRAGMVPKRKRSSMRGEIRHKSDALLYLQHM